MPKAQLQLFAAPSSQDWTQSQVDRRVAAESGKCVVANVRKVDGRLIDGPLIAWAKATGRFVPIDRDTDWGNPYRIGPDGSRDVVIAKFGPYWAAQHGLQSRKSSLRGKVLGCWCHPEACHGHIIAASVNEDAEMEQDTSDAT